MTVLGRGVWRREWRGAADVGASAPFVARTPEPFRLDCYRFARCRSSRSTSKVKDSGTDTGS